MLRVAVCGRAATPLPISNLASQPCRLTQVPLREKHGCRTLHLPAVLCLPEMPGGHLDQQSETLSSRSGLVADQVTEQRCHGG